MLLAAIAQTQSATPAGPGATLYILLAVVLLGFWLLSRRSRKAQQQRDEFRNNLKPGDEVMTGSGLFGTVVDVDGDVITLESTPGQRSLWLRAAIAKIGAPPFASTVIGDADEDEDESDDDALDDDIEVPDDLSSLDDGTDERPEDKDQK